MVSKVIVVNIDFILFIGRHLFSNLESLASRSLLR